MFNLILMLILAVTLGCAYSGGDVPTAMVLSGVCGVCFSLGKYSE